MNRRTRIALPVWPALAAVLLQLLWPVVETQNAAADAFAPEALVHHHHHRTSHDGTPEPGHQHQKSHCDFCTSAAVNAILAPHFVARNLTTFDADAAKPVIPDSPQHIRLLGSRIYARAPPLLS